MMGNKTLNNTFLNELYEGNCIEIMDKLYDKFGPCVDLGFADPPYNLDKAYEGYEDALKDREYLKWCNLWLERYVRLLKPTATLFVLNLPKWTTHHAVFLNQHLYFQNWIVWDALSDPRGNVMPAHYGLLYYTKHPTQYTLNSQSTVEPASRCLRPKCITSRDSASGRENLTDIWHDIHRIKHKKDRDAHPCQLPEKLLERVIKLASNPGDIVLDAFLGTGTSAVVAKKLGRAFIGIEQDKNYLEITKQRLDSYDKPRPSVPKKIKNIEPQKSAGVQLALL
jgi:site-specific DNA-methyltransferase (adenine-specific)